MTEKKGNKKGRAENLIQIQTRPPEEAKALRRKGGLSTSIKKKMAKRKMCDRRCPYWGMCPAKAMSHRPALMGKCAIKQGGDDVQLLFDNIFKNGEAGMNADLMNLWFYYRVTVQKEPTPRVLREAIATGVNLKESIHGRKIKAEVQHGGGIIVEIQQGEKKKDVIQTG